MTSNNGEEQMVAKGITTSVVRVAASDNKAEDKTVAAEQSKPKQVRVSFQSRKPRMRVRLPPFKRTFAQRVPDCNVAYVPPAEESVVEQQNASTHIVEGNDSSAGTVDASTHVAVDSSDQAEKGKIDLVAVTVSEKSLVDETTEKKKVRLHWDLNLPMEAWGKPSDFEDGASSSGRNVEGASK